MITQNRVRKIVKLFGLIVFIFFQTGEVFAQSGRTTPTRKNPPQIEAGNGESAAKKSGCLQSLAYRYVAPLEARDFVRELDKLGACGYRLADVTHIPETKRRKSLSGENEDFGTFKLAGIVKLSGGGEKYQYDFVRAEQVSDLADKLNEFAGNGFNLREIISFDGSIEREEYDAGTEYKIPDKQFTLRQAKNLILLERVAGNTNPVSEYKVLKAGFGFGKETTEKMQALLDEAVKQNYRPVRTFLSAGIGKDKIFDNYQAIILEKTGATEQSPIRFVRAMQRGSFKDRVNDLARNNFKIRFVTANDGMMTENAPPLAPLAYRWLDTAAKNFETELAKITAAGAKFVGATAGDYGFAESALVFEQSADYQNRYEYRTIKFADAAAPLFKTAPAEKSLGLLNELNEQGFRLKKIYFNGIITVLLERQK
jgi:hypothetical protein